MCTVSHYIVISLILAHVCIRHAPINQEKATKKWQKMNGLEESGIVDFASLREAEKQGLRLQKPELTLSAREKYLKNELALLYAWTGPESDDNETLIDESSPSKDDNETLAYEADNLDDGSGQDNMDEDAYNFTGFHLGELDEEDGQGDTMKISLFPLLGFTLIMSSLSLHFLFVKHCILMVEIPRCYRMNRKQYGLGVRR